MTKLTALIATFALAALGLTACGGGGDSTSSSSTPTTTAASTTAGGAGGGGSTIAIAADPSGALAFTQTEVSAKAGSDTVEFDNQAQLGHDVVIEDADGNEIARTDVVTAGTATATADLQPGTYTFFCSVDGHRAAGMEGTLTVN